MRNKNGVTLMQLIITIIVMIIIASIAVFSGLNTMTESTLARTYNEISEIKTKIKEAEVQIEIDPKNYNYEYFFGKTMSELHELSSSSVDTERRAYTEKADIMDFGSRINLPGVDYTSTDTWYFLTNKVSGKISGNVDYREKYSVNKDNLGISKVANEYMINITTGKIYLIDGVEVQVGNEKVKYYEYNDILKIYKSVFED